MADRLTWQNVNAPDFSGSAQALAVAGRLLGDGFTGISETLDGRMGREKDKVSAMALAAAQQYTDAGQWDQAMAQKGLGGALGVDPSQLSPEALKLLGERRTTLLDNAGTIADTGLTSANTGLAYANTGRVNAETDYTRAQIGWGNVESSDQHNAADFRLGEDQYAAGRTRTKDAETDADKQLKKDSVEYVDKTFFAGIDPEADRLTITNDRSLDPKTKAARLEAFDANVPLLYSADKQSQERVKQIPAVVQIETGLGMYQNDVLMRDSTNDDQMNWNAAKGTYGSSGNPKQQLLTSLQTNNGILDPATGIDKTAVSVAAGKVSDIFDKAKKAFPDVPDAMIAHVIGKNIKSDAWLGGLLGGDGLEPDQSAAWKELAKYNDPSFRNTLEQGRIRRENEDTAITKVKTDLEKAKGELSLAYSKGLPQTKIDSILKRIDGIEQRAATITGAAKLSNGKTPASVLNALSVNGAGSAGASRVLPGKGNVDIALQQQAKALGLPANSTPYDVAMTQRNVDMAARVNAGSGQMPGWMGAVGDFFTGNQVSPPEQIDVSNELSKILNR